MVPPQEHLWSPRRDVDCFGRQLLHVVLDRGELASRHQDIPAQGSAARQTGLPDASPAALGVAVIARVAGASMRIERQR